MNNILRLHSKFCGRMHSSTVRQIKSLDGVVARVRFKEGEVWEEGEVVVSRDGMSYLEYIRKLVRPVH